ncbi:UNVERIFIED_CONTAM: hypothetical protein RMT77_006535 [Armadillidium vulgare]
MTNKLENGKVPINIFDKENISNFSKKYLYQILAEILQETLTREIHSDFICKSCFDLINDWDNFNLKVKTTATVLRNTYQETCDSLRERKQPGGGDKNEVFNIKVKCRKYRGARKCTKNIATSISNKPKSFQFVRDKRDKHAVSSADNLDSVLKKSPSTFGVMGGEETENFMDLSCQDTVSETNLSCNSCHFKSNSLKEVEKHRKSHFCHICGLFVTYPKQMKNHLIKVHNFSRLSNSLYKPFECTLCHKRYSSSSGLHNHKKTVHSGATFTCTVCGKSFKHKRLLSLHSIRHSIKNVKCLHCEACFFHTYELNKHINSVHRKIRGYECPICFTYLCQSSSLTHHMSQHANDKKTKLSEINSFEMNKIISSSDKIKINENSFNTICINESESELNVVNSPNVTLNLDPPVSKEFENEKEIEEIEINLNLESDSPPRSQHTSCAVALENSTDELVKSLNCSEGSLSSSLVEDNESKTKYLENYLINGDSLYDENFDNFINF